MSLALKRWLCIKRLYWSPQAQQRHHQRLFFSDVRELPPTVFHRLSSAPDNYWAEHLRTPSLLLLSICLQWSDVCASQFVSISHAAPFGVHSHSLHHTVQYKHGLSERSLGTTGMLFSHLYPWLRPLPSLSLVSERLEATAQAAPSFWTSPAVIYDPRVFKTERLLLQLSSFFPFLSVYSYIPWKVPCITQNVLMQVWFVCSEFRGDISPALIWFALTQLIDHTPSLLSCFPAAAYSFLSLLMSQDLFLTLHNHHQTLKGGRK